jgi:peroxiredoxin
LVGLRDLARTFPDARIFAISRDTPAQSRELARKIASDRRGGPGFPLLSDVQSKVIDRYGIRDPSYRNQENDGVPRPSVFVLDQKGRVKWLRIENDYRERPMTEEISAALDSFE